MSDNMGLLPSFTKGHHRKSSVPFQGRVSQAIFVSCKKTFCTLQMFLSSVTVSNCLVMFDLLIHFNCLTHI